jgi:hypothetical protein
MLPIPADQRHSAITALRSLARTTVYNLWHTSGKVRESHELQPQHQPANPTSSKYWEIDTTHPPSDLDNTDDEDNDRLIAERLQDEEYDKLGNH